MITNKSQFLRTIPNLPVVFSYDYGTNTLPVVQVIKLLHDEANPGFLGINLNLVPNSYKEFVLDTIQVNLQMGLTDIVTPNIISYCTNAIRRYSYSGIRKFYYRGAQQNHIIN